EHAPHRPLAEAGVAVECRRDRASAHGSDDQATPGAGIAEVERAGRLGEAGYADAGDRPGTVAMAGHAGTERAPGPGRVDHVLAFEQPGNARLPHRQGPEDQGSVRDRLVTRDADTAPKGLAATGRGG